MKITITLFYLLLTFGLIAQEICNPILSFEETNFNCLIGTCGNWNFVRTAYSLDSSQNSPSGDKAYSITGFDYPGTANGALVYNLTGLNSGEEYTVWFDQMMYTNFGSPHVGYWKLNDLKFGQREITSASRNEWTRSSYSFTPDSSTFQLKFDAIKLYGASSVYLLLDNVFVGKTETCSPSDCEAYSSFNPEANKTYVLSAWVKEVTEGQVASYSNPALEILTENEIILTAKASGEIIDDWQQIQEVFTLPNNSSNLEVKFKNNSSTSKVYFDDIRIHPLDGSMKSFVYDPVTQRLMAELDENNYATFFEYDQEGGLIRVKKETVDGVYTIQETRSGNSQLLSD